MGNGIGDMKSLGSQFHLMEAKHKLLCSLQISCFRLRMKSLNVVLVEVMKAYPGAKHQ